MERQFNGFSRKAFKFLKDLKANNDKTWFQAHRSDYEQYLLQPLRNLVDDLADFMLDIDLTFEVTPAVNKAISRIHRDTRFSKDKSPYRDCMWIVFKRPGKEWSSRGVGYFMEINATWYRYGMGFYEAAPDIIAQFRKQLDDDPQPFLKAIAPLDKQSIFTVESESYKRPKGTNLPESIRDWYNRKSFYLTCNRKIDKAILSFSLVDDLMQGFELAAPLYHYLLETILRARQQ